MTSLVEYCTRPRNKALIISLIIAEFIAGLYMIWSDSPGHRYHSLLAMIDFPLIIVFFKIFTLSIRGYQNMLKAERNKFWVKFFFSTLLAFTSSVGIVIAFWEATMGHIDYCSGPHNLCTYDDPTPTSTQLLVFKTFQSVQLAAVISGACAGGSFLYWMFRGNGG